jgi:protease-4
MANDTGIFRRILGGIWRTLDRIRKFIHMVLLFGVALIVLSAAAPKQSAELPEKGALLLAPQGALVEQLSGDPLERAIGKVQGQSVQETLVKDLVDALAAAKDDDRVNSLVLRFDAMGGAGLSKLERLAAAIEDFKTSGKKVIAIGDGYERNGYFLAAHADEVIMNPMGFVYLDGYSRFNTYFKQAIDKLSIDYHVWSVGEYKSFVEPYTRDDMSAEAREANQAYLGALWNSYQSVVVAARGLEAGALDGYANNSVSLLADAGGDTGQLALDYGLVDKLLDRNATREYLIEIAGADDEDEFAVSAMGHGAYLASIRARQKPVEGDKVAVLVAVGSILGGSQPPGTIGGDSTAKLIRKARGDEDIKALVLRVDSGGGSAFASEVIRKELQAFQATGRPVIASMDSVAASGGYWISMMADEIFANANTITGSIGIGATIPVISRGLAQLGVNVDGVGTTKLSGQARLDRPLGEDVQNLVRQSIDRGYLDFITRVAEHRNKTVEEVDGLARGRVWIGSTAHELGLVDQLGDIDAAIGAAARRAGMAEDEYSTVYLEKELEFAEQLALRFASVVAPLARIFGIDSILPEGAQRVLDYVEEQTDPFVRLNDPKGIYAMCLCEPN